MTQMTPDPITGKYGPDPMLRGMMGLGGLFGQGGLGILGLQGYQGGNAMPAVDFTTYGQPGQQTLPMPVQPGHPRSSMPIRQPQPWPPREQWPPRQLPLPYPGKPKQAPWEEFGEQLGGYEEQLGGFGEQLGGYEEQMGGFGEQLGGYKDLLSGFGEKFGSFGEKLGGFKDEFTNINDKLQGLERGISGVSSILTDKFGTQGQQQQPQQNFGMNPFGSINPYTPFFGGLGAFMRRY